MTSKISYENTKRKNDSLLYVYKYRLKTKARNKSSVEIFLRNKI